MSARTVIAAFSEEQTVRLTGVSLNQLRYWDRTGFYSPWYAEDNRRLSYSRVYSYVDLLSLRVLNVLRNQYGVPLQHLRDVKDRLSHLKENRWTGVQLYVFRKRVYLIDENTEKPKEIASEQFAIPTIDLEKVATDLKRKVSTLRTRSADEIGTVERRRGTVGNAPVIAGTRIPVATIKRFAEAGYTKRQILREYPDLKLKDITQALEYEDPRKSA